MSYESAFNRFGNPECRSGLGAHATFIRADVRYEDDIRHLMDTAISYFGHLDAAINSAGMDGQPGPLTSESAERYAAIFDTNVLGLLLCLKHELRAMKQNGSGNIVNVSSIYGKIGAINGSIYSASQHAVEGLTKSAALEAAEYGIRVNAIAPGSTLRASLELTAEEADGIERQASIVPLKRMGSVGEVADAIVFVASDRASARTGQSITVDGGLTSG